MPDAAAIDLKTSSRWLAALAHASVDCGMFITPLILFRWPGRHNAYVRRNAAEAFDFQVTVMLVAYAYGFSAIALVYVNERVWPNLYELWILFMCGIYVYFIRAAIRSWRGHTADYPPTLNLLRRRLDPSTERRPWITR